MSQDNSNVKACQTYRLASSHPIIVVVIVRESVENSDDIVIVVHLLQVVEASGAALGTEPAGQVDRQPALHHAQRVAGALALDAGLRLDRDRLHTIGSRVLLEEIGSGKLIIIISPSVFITVFIIILPTSTHI